ncbi:DUF4230 domain-containing protein [Slackia faecicanis]|uniref:DUF4230 domain-containing protein n=1 Tax=Slackia faecicanis TaxID=255723 RepID=A0A3N0AGU0_9ACTN|nr:DUF4230 domain-containing protein [Slackia faecicanis]RNL21314.1 DUF4230 domain-containing protein [Slackia faecicanis]
MKSIRFWGVIIGAAALVAVGFLGAKLLDRAAEPSVTMSADTVAEQLVECSELATMKLEYRGLVTYEEGELPLLTKKAFTMIYDADVRAGVDLSQATVEVAGSSVKVSLPAATVQSIAIDPDSLQFYDQRYALLNWQDRDDTAKALQMAQDDAEEKVDHTAMIGDAQKQAETIVETMLLPFTEDGDYTVEVSFREPVEQTDAA